MTARRSGTDEAPRPSVKSIKSRIPIVASGHVLRPRLIAQLDSAGPEGVIVVHAPAGAGKTSLVASWVASLPRAVSWYTLDERDRDLPALLSNLVAAIDGIRPGSLDGGARLLRDGTGCAGIPDELVEALDSAQMDPATLVLDDFHVIGDDSEMVRLFRELVRHLPHWLQLVVISRSTPALALDRARLEGKVTTIGFEELCFTPSEARELLGRLEPDGGDEWIAETTARAGGWTAALQLFAIGDGARIAPTSMVPSMHTVTDYVFAEALRDQPPELVELLLAIAVVGRVNAPLAHALTGCDDAGDRLHRAFKHDLFLSRCGTGWYELHAVVRDALLERLADHPRRVRDLHTTAARYFESERDFAAALEHWRLAGRHRDALHLLSEVQLELCDAGRDDVVRNALDSLPADAYATDFAATMEFTWCQVVVDRERFLTGLTRLTWWSQRNTVHGTLAARLALLQSVGATIRGDWFDGGRLARQAMEAFGPDWILDSYGRFGFELAARDVALSERWHDGESHVRRADLELASDPVRRLSFEGVRACGEAVGGHPLAALQTTAGARNVAEGTNIAILVGELRLAETIARREIGDHEEVIETLLALADIDVTPFIHVRLLALVELVATHLAHAAIDDARTTLLTLMEMVEHTATGGGARSLSARCAADIALACGDVDDAERWIGEIADSFWHPVFSARAKFARSDHDAALLWLAEAVPRCSRHDVILGLWRGAATPDHDAALKHAAIAVESAVENGMMQTVAAQGNAIVELVERCAWLVPTAWLDRVRLAAVRAPLPAGSGASAGKVAGTRQGKGAAQNASAAVAEPLTERERDVMRFLPSRLTLQEIADELYISMNTLKFHLKVIYRKLGVGSRAEAAEIARHPASSRAGGVERERRP